MVGDTRQGWALFAACALMFLVGVFVCYGFEQGGNPMLAKMGVQTAATAGQPGGNMEGKEVRIRQCEFGARGPPSPPTPVAARSTPGTTALFPSPAWCRMLNMMTDIVIFGGVGAGLYGLLIYCILAVFIAGLMVGRTPEYLGKKLEQKEVKMAMLAIIVTSASILVFSALSAVITLPGARLLESAGRGDRQHEQQRPARFQRDSVRLHQRHRQQRQRLRGHHRQHALVRSHPRPGHAHWPLPLSDSDSRRGGQSRGEEEGARYQRDISPRTVRCSWACWWGPWSSSPHSHISRQFRWGRSWSNF